ncbi:hypothetical protein [Clostridium minihomine]|uniref:hypothetical protein n=1 Tax=Clostridium minihomine TaxID=2045012 RepID=UPI0013EB4F82|nr:hypothetical protein [Clostridium minihomine]
MVSIFYDEKIQSTQISKLSADGFTVYFLQGNNVIRLFMDSDKLKNLQEQITKALYSSDSVFTNSMISQTGH